MAHYARAHVSLYQDERGYVTVVLKQDGEAKPAIHECRRIDARVNEWRSLRKAMVDTLMVGILSCEEYEPF